MRAVRQVWGQWIQLEVGERYFAVSSPAPAGKVVARIHHAKTGKEAKRFEYDSQEAASAFVDAFNQAAIGGGGRVWE